MWKLLVETDRGERSTMVLAQDTYVIGRAPGSAIKLPEQNVSRTHARLTKAGRAWTIEDLKSSNGLFVNGARVNLQELLAHGDVLQIGDFRLFLEHEATPIPAAPPMRARAELPNRLVMLVGPTPGKALPLKSSGRTTIGRSSRSDISISHDSISRAHCELTRLRDGRFEIIDRRSSNGVSVNGARLARAIIDSGDIVELGAVKLRFVAEGELYHPANAELVLLRAHERRFSLATASPWLVFFVVAFVGAIVAWVITR